MNYIILYLELIEGYKTFLNRFPLFKLHNLAQLHRFTINCSEIIHKKKQHPKMLRLLINIFCQQPFKFIQKGFSLFM